MKIANNVIALNVNNNISKTDKKVALAMGRLSSGLKISKVKDDSAGYAIATRFDMQVQGYTKGSENALDGISLIQTAEGYLSSVHELLQRSRELSVQAANGTYSVDDRKKITNEIKQYNDEIDQISKKASFNGINLLDGGAQRLAKNQPIDFTTATAASGKVTYATDGLPAGTINYTIDSVGTPAVYTSTYDGTNAVTTSGGISINGISIGFEAGEDPAVSYAKILEACDNNNITFDSTTGSFYTYEAGSKFSISVEGDPAVLAELGLTATAAPIYGTDAKISGINYVKASDGSTDTTFKPTVISDGNNIRLLNQNNQEIDIEILDKDPISGNFYYDLSDPTASTGLSIKSYSEITDEGPIKIQLGGTMNSVLAISIPKINSDTLNINYTNCATLEGATLAISNFEEAIAKVSTARAGLGAYQNRLDFSSYSLQVAADTTTESLSRIRDTDMAKEMTNYTKENVIFQAATSVLAQANERTQIVLQLIK